MLFGKKKNTKKEMDRLQKEFDKLNNTYLDFLDEHDCKTCKCFDGGNVETFLLRFEKCNACDHYDNIKDIARKMDALQLEIENLRDQNRR